MRYITQKQAQEAVKLLEEFDKTMGNIRVRWRDCFDIALWKNQKNTLLAEIKQNTKEQTFYEFQKYVLETARRNHWERDIAISILEFIHDRMCDAEAEIKFIIEHP